MEQNQTERPNCEMSNCTNKALCIVHGRMICGECVMKIKKKQEEKFWENSL